MNFQRRDEEKLEAIAREVKAAQLQGDSLSQSSWGSSPKASNAPDPIREPSLRLRASETLGYLMEAHDRLTMIEGAICGARDCGGAAGDSHAENLEFDLARICESSAILVSRLSGILSKL